jgi:hypothetical protein
MACGRVLLAIELNAGASIRQNHEAIIRAWRRNPGLHRRRRVHRNERVDRSHRYRRRNRVAGRGIVGSVHRQFAPGAGAGIDINGPARADSIHEQRQSGSLDLRAGQPCREVRQVELNQSNAGGVADDGKLPGGQLNPYNPRLAHDDGRRRSEIRAVARHVVRILGWRQGLRENRDWR